MAKMNFHSEGNLTAAFSAICDRAKNALLAQQHTLMIRLTDRILELTPVWEGDSIVNWRWSPDGNFEELDHRGGEIPTGPTNFMSLGEEPRRSVNEAVVRQSLAQALQGKVLHDMYLTNASDSIVALEYGQLPTPATSRSPHGIVRIAIIEIMGSLH